MQIDYKKLGSRIRIVREKKRLTQEQLAEMVELSNNYISNIELNRSIPSLDTLVKICNALEVTPDYILIDSIYTSKEYIKDEIAKNLNKCNEKSIKIISKFISLILEEQDLP
ncbi:MAG TPA: helix-turn-helix transcriptional regulator [Pseudobacteroides sp.]|uniref:helix-turn-helix domain-containing protein n=1 Tax=Pseudobacteroides sp. TaxID=1968840 RepID=UPI002F94BD15